MAKRRKKKAAKKVSRPRRKKHASKKASKKNHIAVKLKRYPKRPKASASTSSLENYYKKVKEIDSENARRKTLAANIARVIL